jgi:hypothetical protein
MEKMSMELQGMERNKLDFILTDLLPVELSNLFSFYEFYSYLSTKRSHRVLQDILATLKASRVKGDKVLFTNGWASCPLRYKIIKGTDSMRKMSVIHPYAALNIYFFIECYQKDILNYFEKKHDFSLRYHQKNKQLYYKARSKNVTAYFQKQIKSTGKSIIQQAGNYFYVGPYMSINAFTGSDQWRTCNFNFRYYARTDFKACFDSIYTHAFSWIIEKNSLDSKDAKNSHLALVIDRLMQNINGHISNGIVVGPEFSRMIAEILLEHVDKEVKHSLLQDGIKTKRDYRIYRYVDDIFIFANETRSIDRILETYREISEKYLLHLNELKLVKGTTPCLPKDWLQPTRQLSEMIGNYFYHGNHADFLKLDVAKQHVVGKNYIHIDTIKDGINVLMQTYLNDRRTIVSYLLSTLLNNISKKKTGYRLFKKDKGTKNERKHNINSALLILDMALYIYAYFPSFDQTQKVISIISYMDSEIKFRKKDDDEIYNQTLMELNNKFNKYSFIFRNANLFDICDWFPFFREYQMTFNVETENALLKKASELDDLNRSPSSRQSKK